MGKGQDNERALARQFSLWLTAGTDDDAVWRTGGSGGMRRKTEVHHGDLLSTKPSTAVFFQNFCVEVKHVARLDMDGAFRGRKSSSLLKAWRQAREAANAAGRQALLVMRTNFQDPLMVWCRSSDPDYAGGGCKQTRRVSREVSRFGGGLVRAVVVMDGDIVCLAALDNFFAEVVPTAAGPVELVLTLKS